MEGPVRENPRGGREGEETVQVDAEITRRLAELEASAEDLRAALTEAEARGNLYRLFVENSRDIFVLLDAQFNRLWISRAVERIGGYSPDELRGRSAAEEVHPDDLPRVRAAFQKCLSDPSSFFTVEYRYRRKDGTWIHLESVGRNYLTDPGLRGVLVSTRDVTENKLAEQELSGYRRFLEQMVEQRTEELVRANEQLRAEIDERRRTEEALRSQVRRIEMILQTSSDGIHILDAEGRFKQTNPAFSEMTGYTPAELLSMRIQDIDAHFPQERLQEEVQRRFREGPTRFETRHRRKDGTILDVEVQTNGVRLDDKDLLFCSARDVTDRKRAAAALQESEERYRALFEENPFPMWVFDLETLLFLAVNQAAVDQYGYSREELLTMTLEDIRPPEDVPLLRGILDSLQFDSSARTHTARHRRKDGTILEVEVSGRGLILSGRACRLVTALDVTHRLRLEAQLRHSMKMEAVGRLAGGVAHDFNNVLTAILGHCELLLDGTPAGDPRRPHLEEIYRSGDRAASLTRQLLAFSRKQVLQPAVLDLNLVVRDMEQMLRRLIGEDVELTTRLATDVGRVRVDRGQIEQVIANLAVNARDAMPSGGRLTVETSEADLEADPSGVLSGAGPGPGRWVTLTVEDTGCGIPEEVLPRIFEPFFTTKDTGKGTGLGLSTVHGIVEQSGGHVTVHSRPERGTRFRIYLPRFRESDEGGTAERVESMTAGGSETILLAEDDSAVRELVRAVLEEHGYVVLEAEDGRYALEVAEAHNGPIHLLLTDVVMPRMGGRELAERLQSLRPGLRTLYMSGYTPDAIVHYGVLAEGLAFLQKPSTPQALARKVREVLDTA